MKCFENAIKNDADAIMVGHLLVTNIDKFSPASLSKKFIKEILREKYKFNGVVITDSFKMLAIKLLYGEKSAVKKAIKAGNDIVMLKYSIKKETQCIDYIKKLVIKDKISINDINTSVNRIIALKEKYKLNNIYCEGTNIDEANTIIDNINNSNTICKKQ